MQGPVLAYLRQVGVVPPAEAALRRNEVPYSVEEYLKRVASGDLETVKLFLAAGMNPNAQSVDGRSAMELAIKNQQTEVLRALQTAEGTLHPPEGQKK